MRLSLDPLPFVFATTFIADTASVGLPVSNPLNVIVADTFHLDLASYIAHLWLAALVVIVVNVAAFFIIFKGSVTGRFQPMSRLEQGSGVASTIILLVLIAAAYLVASALLFSLGIVAIAGAAALALNLRRVGAFDANRLRTEISWPIFGFIGGMLLIVRGLDAAGVTAGLGKALVHAAGTSHLTAIAVTVVGTAVGSNLINNLPMALVMTSTIPPLHVPPLPSTISSTPPSWAPISDQILPTLAHLPLFSGCSFCGERDWMSPPGTICVSACLSRRSCCWVPSWVCG